MGMWGLGNSIVIMMSNLIMCFAREMKPRIVNYYFTVVLSILLKPLI